MKDTRELIGLLTVKVQRFSVAPGGIPLLTPEDISHVLAMVKSPSARLYARVKYADQTEFASELVTDLLYACGHIEGSTKWRNRKDRPGLLSDVCALALYEAIHPHVCPWCHGRGEAQIGPRVIACDACHGEGKRFLTDPDRAKLLKMAKSSWYETWPERYTAIQAIPDKWEDLIAGALTKRLRQTGPVPA